MSNDDMAEAVRLLQDWRCGALGGDWPPTLFADTDEFIKVAAPDAGRYQMGDEVIVTLEGRVVSAGWPHHGTYVVEVGDVHVRVHDDEITPAEAARE